MNNRSEDASERKLSPEALARKNEKRRLSKLRIKEKKRDEREGGGADPGADERPKGSEGKAAGRSVSVVATNSETVKNILGIKTAGNKSGPFFAICHDSNPFDIHIRPLCILANFQHKNEKRSLLTDVASEIFSEPSFITTSVTPLLVQQSLLCNRNEMTCATSIQNY